MTIILIIFCIWGASALVRMSKERKRIEVKYADLHSCLYYLSGEVW